MEKQIENSLQNSQQRLFEISALEGSTLDVIVCQYADSRADIYPLSPDYHSALSQCRIAIQKPAYESFTFLRITLPGGMVKALNYIDKKQELGESPRIVSLFDHPADFQTTILTIALEKGII